MSASDYDEAYKLYPPYEDTPMKHMYEKVAKMIPRLATVVDLGCGNGYLAAALWEAGYTGKYTGLDFSPVALEMAEECLLNRQQQKPIFENPTGAEYVFRSQDLYEWYPSIDSETHRTYFTCFEVLEHLNDDCTIIDRLPARSHFIFSVPNYWSDTHVRTFDSVGTAMERYSNWLKFQSWVALPTKLEEATIHLYTAIRRADKW